MNNARITSARAVGRLGVPLVSGRPAIRRSNRSRDVAASRDHSRPAKTPGNTPRAVQTRIERSETKHRQLTHWVDGSSHTFAGGYVEITAPATSDRSDRVTAERGQVDEQLTDWRGVLAKLGRQAPRSTAPTPSPEETLSRSAGAGARSPGSTSAPSPSTTSTNPGTPALFPTTTSRATSRQSPRPTPDPHDPTKGRAPIQSPTPARGADRGANYRQLR